MADIKLTGLAAITAVTSTDLLYLVDDVGGTPTSKKITAADLLGGTTAVPFDVYLTTLAVGLTGGDALLGLMHVKSGASGGATPLTVADDLVIEGSGDAGITIMTPAANTGNIFFGDETSSSPGRITFAHTGNVMSFRSGTEQLRLSPTGVRIEDGMSGDPTDLFHVAASGNASALVVRDSNGFVGCGILTPLAHLHVVGAIATQLRVTDSESNATTKTGIIQVPHYTSAEQPVVMGHVQNSLTDNIVAIGGANSNFNAATQISFWVAADTTTVTGASIARMTSVGLRVESGVSGDPTDLFHVAATGDANALVVRDSNGYVGFGEPAPTAAIDIVATGAQQLRGTNVTTDSVNKQFYIQTRHFLLAEQDTACIVNVNTTSANVIQVGGGAGALNAATSISLWTAGNNTTTTGTEQMRITKGGVRIEDGITGAATDLFHVAAAGDANAILVEDATGDVGFKTATPDFDIDLDSSVSGGDVTMRIRNSSDTASSDARLYLQVAGTTARDPFVRWEVAGTTDWVAGIDNNDSDIWGIWNNATPGSNPALTIHPTGEKVAFGSTTDGVKVPVIAGDPSSPTDGDIWYDSVSDTYQGRENGVTVTFTTT